VPKNEEDVTERKRAKRLSIEKKCSLRNGEVLRDVVF